MSMFNYEGYSDLLDDFKELGSSDCLLSWEAFDQSWVYQGLSLVSTLTTWTFPFLKSL